MPIGTRRKRPTSVASGSDVLFKCSRSIGVSVILPSGMLSRHLEGELDPATCRRLAAHVDACGDCGRACSSLRRALGTCARSGDGAVPRAARTAIRRAIERVVEDANAPGA